MKISRGRNKKAALDRRDALRIHDLDAEIWRLEGGSVEDMEEDAPEPSIENIQEAQRLANESYAIRKRRWERRNR